jgi:hypothetical protein
VQPFAQHSDLSGVEAGEPPHGGDALFGNRGSFGANVVHFL